MLNTEDKTRCSGNGHLQGPAKPSLRIPGFTVDTCSWLLIISLSPTGRPHSPQMPQGLKPSRSLPLCLITMLSFQALAKNRSLLPRAYLVISFCPCTRLYSARRYLTVQNISALNLSQWPAPWSALNREVTFCPSFLGWGWGAGGKETSSFFQQLY